MRQQRKLSAFTLIEMLVVIAIIGILAAIITATAIRVAQHQRISRVDAEKHRLINVIDSYQHDKGSYPPDNGLLKGSTDPDRGYAATNQLFYELTGPTWDENNKQYKAFDGSIITSNEYFNAFNRVGVANSIEPKLFFKPPPKAGDYKSNFVANAQNANVFMVPVDLQNNIMNPWRYDASSSLRHNSDSYDVWAVFSVGNKIVTNGNW